MSRSFSQLGLMLAAPSSASLRRWAPTVGVIAILVGYPILTKAGLLDGWRPIEILALRILPVGFLFLPFAVAYCLQANHVRRLPQIFVAGTCQGLLAAAFTVIGLSLAPAAHAVISPAAVAPVAVLLRLATDRRVASRALIAAAAAIAGILLILIESNATRGDLCFIAAGTCVAVHLRLLESLRLSSAEAIGTVGVSSSALFLPIYVALTPEPLNIADIDSSFAGQALLQAGLFGVIFPILMAKSVAAVGHEKSAYALAIVPVLTVATSAIHLSEQVDLFLGAGTALVALAAWGMVTPHASADRPAANKQVT